MLRNADFIMQSILHSYKFIVWPFLLHRVKWSELDECKTEWYWPEHFDIR